MPLDSDPDMFADVPISQWETVMPGYVACVDEPGSHYWKQLSNCKALNLPVPNIPFPHDNKRSEYHGY
jgi:hypothetical protein